MWMKLEELVMKDGKSGRIFYRKEKGNESLSYDIFIWNAIGCPRFWYSFVSIQLALSTPLISKILSYVFTNQKEPRYRFGITHIFIHGKIGGSPPSLRCFILKRSECIEIFHIILQKKKGFLRIIVFWYILKLSM